ncbi:MAG: phosphopantetheinyl transferase [Solidesulfovibrio magneticus str. Maddingley MBC34]|uniref:Phosphopantetheinyl transferase n=1 Tax=Solidesulfovibrio magneticus str. Maddingley MBC34 TaxID=1206767 RepID=K6H696_9BACT|nr:MAG: phosphopantetheinyl transferase [Solidesulfovibrio magneticus str. Maddingley MBC34]
MSPSPATTGDPASVLDELTGAWRVIQATARAQAVAWHPVLAMGPTPLSFLEAAAPAFCGPRELARLRALTIPRGRQAFLQGRLAAKTALRAMLSRLEPAARFDPRRVEVGNGHLGRPLVHGTPGLGVSLSRCQGFAAAVAFPLDLPLGLDLERVRPQNVLALSDCIAPRELAMALLATPPEAHAGQQLTLVWCLKEALGKLLGCGLTTAPEVLAIASLGPVQNGLVAGYTHAAGYQGLAALSASMILALAAPGNVTLELDLGALIMV